MHYPRPQTKLLGMSPLALPRHARQGSREEWGFPASPRQPVKCLDVERPSAIYRGGAVRSISRLMTNA